MNRRNERAFCFYFIPHPFALIPYFAGGTDFVHFQLAPVLISVSVNCSTILWRSLFGMRLKTHTRLFMLILFLFALTAQASAQNCLSYDTDGVQLRGTISKKTFPGPPNYENIRKGDEPETYWILHLVKPICTTANTDNDAEKNVNDLQLILTVKQYALYRKLVGKRARITGKLSHAITGHHHTPVMMEVT